jgi:hypothetical protein
MRGNRCKLPPRGNPEGKIIMNDWKHSVISGILKNDGGSVIVPALIVLMLVSILGVMSIRTSSTDMNISTNQQVFERAFYAAEAAKAFVRNNPVLYGATNLAAGTPVNFTSQTNPSTNQPITSPVLGAQESFDGTVEYLGSSHPPRGTGFSAGQYRAQNYKMICRGHFSGINVTTAQIESGFFRIGF